MSDYAIAPDTLVMDHPCPTHIRIGWALIKQLGRAGNMQDAKYYYCAMLDGAEYRTMVAATMARRLGVDLPAMKLAYRALKRNRKELSTRHGRFAGVEIWRAVE